MLYCCLPEGCASLRLPSSRTPKPPQNIPGANNGLKDNGKPLTNWWTFLGDFDNAVTSKMKLTDE